MDPLSTVQVDILKELSSLTTTPDIPDAAYDLITRVCRLQDMATETINTCASALNEIRHYGLLHRKWNITNTLAECESFSVSPDEMEITDVSGAILATGIVYGWKDMMVTWSIIIWDYELVI